MTTHNAHPDDLLDAAVLALRQTPVPDGPPAAVLHAAAALDEFPRRRWQVRRPLTHLLAASVVLALLGTAVGHLGGLGGGVAFADVAEQVRRAKTLYYRVTVTADGQPPVTMKYTLAAPALMRVRSGEPNDSILIFDLARSEGVVLLPAAKQALKLTSAGALPGAAGAVAGMIQSLREIAHDSVDDLGPRRIDGQPTFGFRVKKSGQEFVVWADPRSKQPVRVEATLQLAGRAASAVLDEFRFDEEIDPSLFSLVPPAGYTVIDAAGVDLAEPGEQDLVYLLRALATRNGGRFPDAVDMPTFQKLFKDDPAPRNRAEGLAATLKLTRALVLIHLSEKAAAWRYAGRGVRLGDAGAVIAAWKPHGGSRWKAIAGDLSVRDVDVSEAGARSVGGRP